MYISGKYPNKANIIMTIINNITFTIIFDRLTNVGIVATGNFIFVTK